MTLQEHGLGYKDLDDLLHKPQPLEFIIGMFGWRHGSVVMTSVFGWWTFSDLWFTCDHFVDKMSAMGQPTRPTQPSIRFGSVIE